MKKYVFIPILITIIGIVTLMDMNISAQEKNSVIHKYDNILFLGDSITEWYPIKDIYGDLPIVGSGKAGYETKDLLDRMEDMAYAYNPTKVILLIGTNDLKYDEDDEEKVAENIKEIIEKIKKNRPMAKIYYQSIYPVNRSLGATEERYNDEIDEVNNIIKEYCQKNGVVYIDMNKELRNDNGDFDKKYAKDGLHPNALGYARISQVLSKYIYELQ